MATYSSWRIILDFEMASEDSDIASTASGERDSYGPGEEGGEGAQECHLFRRPVLLNEQSPYVNRIHSFYSPGSCCSPSLSVLTQSCGNEPVT